MPIPKKILRKDVRAESLEELLDADYIRLVIDETGLNFQVTDKGDRALFEPGEDPSSDDPSYARFKNKFRLYTAIAAIIILCMIVFMLRYQ